MASIITLSDLEAWIPEGVDADSEAFALVNVDAASLVVSDTAGHPEWTPTTAPARARLIAVQLAKRAYRNPDAVVRSNVGPLGESTVEDYARTLELTPREREELEAMAPDAALQGGAGEMYLLNLGGAPLFYEDTIYTPDLSGGLFPMYQANTVGSP